jgi:hypothetical protein
MAGNEVLHDLPLHELHAVLRLLPDPVQIRTQSNSEGRGSDLDVSIR